jgi:hypothetical protein
MATIAQQFRECLRRAPQAETVQFFPGAGGAPRTLRVLLETSEQEASSGEREDRLERLLVTTYGDPTDVVVGGIDVPAMGDAIQRSNGARYGYSGEVVNQSGYSWQLRYQRRQPKTVGVSQVQRG